MRYGVRMLQVVRVRPEPVEGLAQILVYTLYDHLNFHTALAG
jgi:hypothetical protein